ncbi:MAG TPA: S16 family serine protease [Streptomyces sp.]|nr:S16 family serine protease [Streptomyces sp.]
MNTPDLRKRLSPRRRTLLICAVPLVALLAVVALAPLPFSLAQPGLTANVIGKSESKPVISVSGTDVREKDNSHGRLMMTTIAATPPDASVDLSEVVGTWFRTDRAVMPTAAVYPVGETTKEVREHSDREMKESQDAAVKAALRKLHISPGKVQVTLRLADVGGPSAGLFFTLGIIDKIDGNLTGGRSIAGTGTIKANGDVGPVGGVTLKTKAAKRDGATVFLVPKAECGDAKALRPEGLRLVPVTDLDGALDSLKALKDGRRVPSC